MTVAISFIPPIFEDEYDGHKMRILVNELERLLGELTRGVAFDPDDPQPGLELLSILESQITDANLLARIAGDETITGTWEFNAVTDFNSDVEINDGTLKILDSTGSDSLAMDHDGTDFNFALTNTQSVFYTGASASYQFDRGVAIVASSVQPFSTFDSSTSTTASLFPASLEQSGAGAGTFIVKGMDTFRFLGGTNVRVYNSGDTDFISIDHDGVDVNFTHSGTTDWNITGITAIKAGTVDADFDAITAVTLFGELAASFVVKTQNAIMNADIAMLDTRAIHFGTANDISIRWDGIDFEITGAAGSQVWNFRDGPHIKLWDDSDTDSAMFDHDGTDFNTTFPDGTTVDWNISGLTNVKITAALTATSYGGILEANLLDKVVNQVINADYTFLDTRRVFWGLGNDVGFVFDGTDFASLFNTGAPVRDWNIDVAGALTGSIKIGAPVAITGALTATSIATGLGTEALPSRFFEGDPDTGSWSPGANIYAISVGGTEAIRYTEASSEILEDHSFETGITASDTQTQGQRPLLSSYNEVSIVVNNNDVVTLPPASEGRWCLVINGGVNKLQVFPESGDDLGQGIDSSDTIKSGTSLLWIAFNGTTWHEVATKLSRLQDVNIDGIGDNELMRRQGGLLVGSGANLQYDGNTLTAAEFSGPIGGDAQGQIAARICGGM